MKKNKDKIITISIVLEFKIMIFIKNLKNKYKILFNKIKKKKK